MLTLINICYPFQNKFYWIIMKMFNIVLGHTIFYKFSNQPDRIVLFNEEHRPLNISNIVHTINVNQTVKHIEHCTHDQCKPDF